jgi:hypothetical protein
LSCDACSSRLCARGTAGAAMDDSNCRLEAPEAAEAEEKRDKPAVAALTPVAAEAAEAPPDQPDPTETSSSPVPVPVPVPTPGVGVGPWWLRPAPPRAIWSPSPVKWTGRSTATGPLAGICRPHGNGR